jgi:hypothetical protein
METGQVLLVSVAVLFVTAGYLLDEEMRDNKGEKQDVLS